MTTSLSFPDGGLLSVEYEGQKNGSITLTAPANEGVDRTLTMSVTTADGNATASVSVTQEGKRELFVASTDDTFVCTDGNFQVLKDGIQQ